MRRFDRGGLGFNLYIKTRTPPPENWQQYQLSSRPMELLSNHRITPVVREYLAATHSRSVKSEDLFVTGPGSLGK